MQQEIWKDVKGYKNIYQVSNLGRVKRLSRTVKGKNNTNRLLKEKILKCSDNGYGYLIVLLSKKGKTKGKMVHRLVAEAFIPNPHNKKQVNHIDGIKCENYVDNLEWVTPQENMKHAFDHGFMNTSKGENHYRSRRVYSDRLNINFSCIREASEYLNLSHTSICRILSGKTKSNYYQLREIRD